jgi:SAM-dependent methyltransferase
VRIDGLAENFANAVDAYERGRPEYPSDAIDHLVEVLDLPGDRMIVELGAGSGKFTRALVRAGLHPRAVEPLAPMREALHRNLPEVPVVDGTAESIPFPDRSADAVLAAQAFHWFDPARAIPELGRVLRPEGGLGLVWNVRDETVPWVARFGAIIRAREPKEAPQYRKGRWKGPIIASEIFRPLETAVFAHEHLLDAEAVVARALSISYIARLPPDGQRAVEEEVRELLATDPALTGRRQVAFPYRTEVYWTFRR